MSRLDHFLVTDAWMNMFLNVIRWGCMTGLSDHHPIILKNKETNCGPKPFKVINSWSQMEGYREYVRAQWKFLKFEGLSTFVLNEKLKVIKSNLKEWRKLHASNLEEKLKKE